MRTLISGLCCLLVIVMSASAEEKGYERKGQGYVFFAPGGATSDGYTDPILHFGVGGERTFFGGFGVGGEIGYVFPTSYVRDGLGLGSLNAYYQFGSASPNHKLVPFVTGGFSAIFHQRAAGGCNVGAGVNYWIRPRVGLRAEFRDHFSPSELNFHIWEGRIGLSF